MRTKAVFLVCLLSVVLLTAGCLPDRDFDRQLDSIVQPYRFNIAGWEFKTIADAIREPANSVAVKDETAAVIEYFTLAQQTWSLKSEIASGAGRGQDTTSLKAELERLEKQKGDLNDTVTQIIQRQVTEALKEQGIFNPADKYIRWEVVFPPVNFRLEEPPHLLVISPRDRIERSKDILLTTDASLEQTVDIEARVDKLNVSSLVVPIGGLATYPSFVVDDCGLRFALDAITEEWVHQYLTFRPLGFLYFLDSIGVVRNYDVATMDETLAGIVSKEIGAMVYRKYYSSQGNGDSTTPQPDSEFSREMREIRRTVDSYLAQGKIEAAEQFMEAKRQDLAAKGYYIRKLNQAYFAFYGTYADSPTSIDPIGTEMKELRSRSATLKDFLDTVSVMTSRSDLKAAYDAGH